MLVHLRVGVVPRCEINTGDALGLLTGIFSPHLGTIHRARVTPQSLVSTERDAIDGAVIPRPHLGLARLLGTSTPVYERAPHWCTA